MAKRTQEQSGDENATFEAAEEAAAGELHAALTGTAIEADDDLQVVADRFAAVLANMKD